MSRSNIKTKVLSPAFFNRDTLTVAKELLGKYLVVRTADGDHAHRIVEVEGYDGFEDKASHAHKGRTARTEVMFGPPGYWYVYLVYGMHHMLNIVTGEKEYPAAVLIRGVEGVSGPGRLTNALGITKAFNTMPATKDTGLWIEDRGDVVSPDSVVCTPRVGVAYAGDKWAHVPYRFLIQSK